jgi:hypothetical protein
MIGVCLPEIAPCGTVCFEAIEMDKKSGRIQPGEVRNPGGRPKVPEDVKEALRALVPSAVETLGELIRNGKDEKVRLQASETVLNRCYGTPPKAPEDREADASGQTVIAQALAAVLARRDG